MATCNGDVQVCKDVGTAYTECLGQVMPGPEFCYEKDNNCDGAVDK
ncbi:hypothetical protein WME79_38550 [Sorangium sp. So ce726]